MVIYDRCIECPLKEQYKKDCGVVVSHGKSSAGLSMIKVPDCRCKMKYRKEHKAEIKNNSIWK